MVTLHRISGQNVLLGGQRHPFQVSGISRPLGDSVRFSQQPDFVTRRGFLKTIGAALLYHSLDSTASPLVEVVKAEEVKPAAISPLGSQVVKPLLELKHEKNFQSLFSKTVMPEWVANNLNTMIRAIAKGRSQEALRLMADLSVGTSEETKKFLYMLKFTLNDIKDSDRSATLVEKIMSDKFQNLDGVEVVRIQNFLNTLFTAEEYKALERVIDGAYNIASGDDTFIGAFAYNLAVKNDKENTMRSRLTQKLENNQRFTNEEMDALKGRITLPFPKNYRDLLLKAIDDFGKPLVVDNDPGGYIAIMLGLNKKKAKANSKPISEDLKQRLKSKVQLLTKLPEDQYYDMVVEHVKGLLTTDDCKNLYDILKKDKQFQAKYKDKYGTDEALKAFALSKSISETENGDRLAAVARALPLKPEQANWVVHQIALYMATMDPTYGLDVAARVLGTLLEHNIDPFPRNASFGTTAFTNAIASVGSSVDGDRMVEKLISIIENKGKTIEDKPDFMRRNTLRYLSLINPKYPDKLMALKRILASSDKKESGYKVKVDLSDRDFGINPLMSAAFMGDANYMKTLLLRSDVDVNHQDKTSDKLTALAYAVQGNRKESVQAILDAHNNGSHKLDWNRNKKALELAKDNEAAKLKIRDTDSQSYQDAVAISEVLERQMAQDKRDERYLPDLSKIFQRLGIQQPLSTTAP